MNNKGFTLVELLVAMAIMGLLIIMAFPTMRAVQTNNTNKKYEAYGDTILSAAKLYVDSYGDDLFDPDRVNQKAILYLSDLQLKDLIKDIGISDSSCINGESNIQIIKYKDDYTYCLHLKCTSGGSTVYEKTNKKGACEKFDTVNVNYEFNGITKTIEVVKGDNSYKILPPEHRNINFDFNGSHVVFNKWKVEADPTPNEYNPNTIYPKAINSDVTFRALTRPWEYYIYYQTNGTGCSGALDHNPLKCIYGQNCNLDEMKCKKTGHTFKYWQKDSSHTYNDKANVKNSIGNNITSDGERIYLTPIFRKNILYIMYSPNGASFNDTRGAGYNLYIDSSADTSGSDSGADADEEDDLGSDSTADDDDDSDDTDLDSDTDDSDDIGIDFGAYGDIIAYYGDPLFHSMEYGDSSDLYNWNNSGAINLFYAGRHIDAGSEWNTKANGTGTSYNHNTKYAAASLCPALANDDCVIVVYANWKQNYVYIKINANGGSLAANHGSTYTLTGNVVKNNSSDIIHSIPYGGKLGTYGLVNYNNSTALNLTRANYKIEPGDEWNTASNGNGLDYNQDKAYKASDFCDASANSCTITLYANWEHNPPIGRPAKPKITNPSNGKWTNKNIYLTVKTSTDKSKLGYWYYTYDKNTLYKLKRKKTNKAAKGISSFKTNPWKKQQDRVVYIRVCNKEAANGKDNAKCSKYAKTKIRIDKTKPTASISNTSTVCGRAGSDGYYYAKQNTITLKDSGGSGLSRDKSDAHLYQDYTITCTDGSRNHQYKSGIKNGSNSFSITDRCYCGSRGYHCNYRAKACDVAGNCSSQTTKSVSLDQVLDHC